MTQQARIYWSLKEAGEDFPGLLANSNAGILSEGELYRLSQMKIDKRRKEWLLGRLTAKTLLTSPEMPWAGLPLSTIVIENKPEGAPYLSGFDEQGSLSLSHRQEIAACAFTPDPNRNLGIDLELIESRATSFVEDFFTHAEADYTLHLTDKVKDVWVTLVWSAKEALLKAWQKGLRLDTRSIEIFPIDQKILSLASDQWQPINWAPRLDGYPECWAGWRRWKNFIITLAYTLPKGDGVPIPLEITQVRLPDFPIS